MKLAKQRKQVVARIHHKRKCRALADQIFTKLFGDWETIREQIRQNVHAHFMVEGEEDVS